MGRASLLRFLLFRGAFLGIGILLGSSMAPPCAADDELSWSTFIGGGGYNEGARALAIAPDGNLLIAGFTSSGNFPVTPGAYDETHNGETDAFVAKLDPTGTTVIWATYIGGTGVDWACALAVDRDGQLIVTGSTGSSDFPTSEGAYDREHNGSLDVFVVKLDASGSELLWSTYLGGDWIDRGEALAITPTGEVLITGETCSPDFPTTPGAYDESYNWGMYENFGDAFVTRLNATGTHLVWSSFLGGSATGNYTGQDYADGLALDSQANVLICGTTASADFPTTPGAYDETFNLGKDVFISKFASSGSELLWSTFVGGTEDDQAHALILDSQGRPVIAGNSRSTDFPTTPGAYDESFNGNVDAIIAKLDASGSTLLWSTYLGGGDEKDLARALTLAPGEEPVVTGFTWATDFPTTQGAYDPTHNGDRDVFISRLADDGSALIWSSYLGASDRDEGRAVVADAAGDLIIGGRTLSPEFPTTPGAFDESHNGGYDAFVAKLNIPGGADVAWDRNDDLACLSGISLPNPFLDQTTIRFLLDRQSPVTLSLHDASGRRVRCLLDEVARSRGSHQALWDGRDDAGLRLPSGAYTYRLVAGQQELRGLVIQLR